jgi:tRNA G46 methylase TrmB
LLIRSCGFDTVGPFELEIGCGKGGFLLARAKARPDVRLLESGVGEQVFQGSPPTA